MHGGAFPAASLIVLSLNLSVACHNRNFSALPVDHRLEELSQGHGLSVLGCWLLHTTGLMAAHQIPPARAARLFSAIESGYQCVPYHNKSHGKAAAACSLSHNL